MISETTNFSRDSIGTPTLNAYEDIRLNEVSLKELILDDSETETADVVSILGTENFIRRDAETIHAFRFGCKDYFGRYFNYVTVRRQIGDNDMNSFESTNDVWMAAICYDKNNNIVETFFSNERNKQENGVYETTWNFDPFIIKSSYAFIEFRITQTEGEVNLNPNSHSMRMRTSNIIHNPTGNSQKKFYLDGWYTIDQSNTKSDFTTDFVVGMTKRYSSLTKHVTDINVHLTQDLKDKIENISDDISSQLNPIDERLGNVEKEIDSITDFVQNYNPSLYEKTFNLGLNVEGYKSAYGIDVGVSNLKKGYISHVEIFSEIETNRSGSFGDYYLAAQIFKNGESNSVIYPTKKTIYSTSHININEETQKYVYDFDDLYVSDDDYFIRFMIVESSVKGTVIPQPNSNGNVGIMLVNYDATHSNNTGIIGITGAEQNYTPRCDISYDFKNAFSDISSLTDEFLLSPKSLKDSSLNPKDYTKDGDIVSQNSEMIFAFSCVTNDIKNKKITSITLHKKDDASGLDTDTSATSSQKEVWLFATCYDNAGQMLEEHTYFSSNKAKQNANERDVIWYFDNFNVRDEFKTIEFRITNTEGVAERNNIANHSNTNRIRSSTYNTSNGKLYIPGWTTLNQANVKENITTNFTIGLEEELNYVETTNDDLMTHKNNSSLHFDNEEKSFLIKESFSYTPFEEGDDDDNYSSCHGFQLGPKHIKSGLLKEIRIPHKASSNADITDENGNYMAVQIFRNGDPDLSSDNKSLFETYFSENKHVVTHNVAGEYHFTFNNLYIPSSFKYVRFIPVKSKDVVPNGFNVSNCSKMALIPIKRNNTTNFDDDGCYVLVGNSNKISLLTKCTLIYSKEKTNIPFYDIVSRGWRFEVPNSSKSTTEQFVKSLHEQLTQVNKAVVSSCVYESNYYNPMTTEFEKSKNTYIITIIYPTPKSGEEVIESFGNFNLRSGYDTDYPILYPIYF